MALTTARVRLRLALSLSSSFLHRLPTTTTTTTTTTNPLYPFLSRQPPQEKRRWFHTTRPSLFESISLYEANKVEPDAMLFEGDYNHWLVVMDFGKDPQQRPPPHQMIDIYVHTLAQVLGSVEEAKKKISVCSTTTHTCFQADIDEATSQNLRRMPGVIFVLPNSHLDLEMKEVGGDNVDETITPGPPVQHGRINTNRQNDQRSRVPMLDQQGNHADNQHGSMSGERRGYMPQRQYIIGNHSPSGKGERGNPMSNWTNCSNEGRDHDQSGRNTFPSPQEGHYIQGMPFHQGNYSQGMPSHQGNYNHGGNHAYDQHGSMSGEGRDYLPQKQNIPGNYEGGRGNPMSNRTNCFNEGGDHYQSGGNTFPSLQQGNYNQGMPSHQGNYSQGMPSHQGNYNNHGGNYAYNQHGSMSRGGRGYMPQGQNIPGNYSPTGEGGMGNPMSNRTNCSDEGRDHYQSGGNTSPSLQQGDYNQGMPSHHGNYSEGVRSDQGNYNHGGNYAYNQHELVSGQVRDYMPQRQIIPGDYSPTCEGGMDNPLSNRINYSNEGRDRYQSGRNTFLPLQQGNYNQGTPSHQGNYSQGMPFHQGNYNHGGNHVYNQHGSMSGEGRGYMPQTQNFPGNYSPTGEEGKANPMSNRTNCSNEGRDHHQSGGNTFSPLQQGYNNQGMPSHQGNYSQGMPSHQGNYNHGVPTYQGNYNQGYTQPHQMENFAAGDQGSHGPHEEVNNHQGDHGYNQSQGQIRNFPDNHGGYTPQGQMEYPGVGRINAPVPPMIGADGKTGVEFF